MDATFMTTLHINDVRHLKNIHIPLSQDQRKALILTGKNGSGKTSVLQSLEQFLRYVVSPTYNTQDTCQSYVADYEQLLTHSDVSEEEKRNAESNKSNLKLWKEQLSNWTDGTVAEYVSYADLRNKYQNGNYVLAYYGDRREIEVEISKNIEKVELKNIYSFTDHPSKQLVKYLVNLKTTEAFAKTNDNLQRAEEIQKWFIKFEGILRNLYDDDSLVLDFNIETFEFKIMQKDREPYDFKTMSMGYAALFDIIGDLIMRMEAQKSYNLEGLVLIDEIETHLHVELQKKIVPILVELFPNIQFVLTTHSPFILNSTPNAVLYDLEHKKLVEDSLTNLPYEGIVEGYFNVDLLSQELRKKFTEYQILVKKTDLTDMDYARASELELYLDEVPDYLALDFSTEYSRLKLEFADRG